MRRSLLTTLTLLLCAIPVRSFAQDLTPVEQAFFDKHIAEFVTIVPTHLADAALQRVFTPTFDEVKVVIKQGDSVQTNGLIMTRVGEKLISLEPPSSDADLPDFQKMISATFKLQTDTAAKTFQQALDAAYPIIGEADKKVKTFRHTGNQWIFVRGTFFNDRLGYLLQTDATGSIRSVKFMLKLP